MSGPTSSWTRRHSVTGRHSVAPGIGLMVAAVLLVAAFSIPELVHWRVHALGFEPLQAQLDPRTGPGTVPAVLFAVVASLVGTDLAARVRWRALLLVAFAAGAAWMVLLAVVDGREGLGHHLVVSHLEYLLPARHVDSVGVLLAQFVDRVPLESAHHWHAHVAGHPPGALLFFVLLTRVGLGGWFATGMTVVLVAATTAVAVLVTLRLVGAETAARRVAPVVVLAPAAIWQAVSADAVFAAVAAWGVALVALAVTRGSPVVALAAGLVFGSCVLLSYGLTVFGLVPLALVVRRRAWRLLPPLGAGLVAVPLALVPTGFVWTTGLAAVHARYYQGVAAVRPAGYWVWADVAVFLLSAGPALALGAAALADRRRRPPGAVRTVDWDDARWLTLGAAAALVVADLSLMSKGEVERIWLPFAPWLLVSCAWLDRRWLRVALVLQLATGLVVEHLFHTGW